MGRSKPPQTPLALGLAWASRVTSLALEFVLPTMAGWWLDGKLGSRPVGMIVGAVVGFLIGMIHLLQIARNTPRPPAQPSRPPRP